ncbi:MAG TPA: efflux RND transporter periplasmic adaptor subunit [Terracidiphilus sp.]|jgi:RND family efflux transporter MFP subunit
MANDPHSQPQAAQTEPRTAQHHDSAPDHKAVSGRGTSIALAIVAIAVVALAIVGIIKRRQNDTVLARTTQENAPPAVIVRPPDSGAAVNEIVLPGNVTAFTDAPLLARTSGYLSHWYYDIGAKVKKGALLAEIATPELDQQVLQAQADLATSEANAGNAKAQADRYQGLVTSDAVSKQDTETFVTQAASTSAAVKSAQANLARLKELQGFEKVYAPFDGVVTARGVDTGQLINQGSGSELFHMQALQILRVYTNVPEVYMQAVKHGEKMPLSFAQYPGKSFDGTLVRTAESIDPANRTLLVEIDVDNRKGELLPGSLAQVHFKVTAARETFIIPAAALIFRRDGLRIATVVEISGRDVAHLVPITIGEDNGATVQVINGLNANDRVIQDPPDSLIEGEKVYVETPNTQNDAQNPANPQPAARKDNGGK